MDVTTINYDGGGWTIPYLIGISSRLNNAGKVLKYAGVSAGACVAIASALGVSMDDLMEDVLKAASECRPYHLRTLSEVERICNKMIKDDEQVRRLTESQSFAVGITRVNLFDKKTRRFVGDGTFSTVVVSKFKGKDDLVEKVVSSCRLPMINTLLSTTGKPYEYIDGNLLVRFIEVPWEQSNEIRVSSNKDADGSDVSCQEEVPLRNHIIPYDEKDLVRLYEIGKADGYDVLNRVLHPNTEKIVRIDQDTNDWSTCFDKRLHVDRRLDLRLPKEGACWSSPSRTKLFQRGAAGPFRPGQHRICCGAGSIARHSQRTRSVLRTHRAISHV